MALSCVEDVSIKLIDALKICEDINFVRIYPSDLTQFPIKRPTVSVGLKKANLPFSEGTFSGPDVNLNKYYGITLTASYELKICVPKTMSGEDCYKAFDEIADALLGCNDLYIINVYCADISYDRVMGALVLTAGVDLSADLYNIVEA